MKGKLRLGSSDEERLKGTQDGFPKGPEVGKAVLTLTFAPASRKAVKLVFQEFATGAPSTSTEAARQESAG